MPQLHKGRRVALTTRLPYDLAGQVAIRAQQKRWSVSQYLVYCVERALAADRNREGQQRATADDSN